MRASTPIRQAALVAVAAGVVLPRLRRRLGLHPVLVSALAWQAPVALALAAPGSRARSAAVYALQMNAYFVHYEMPADDRDRIRRRMKIRYPIAIDRVLGAGASPTERLQRALHRPGSIRAHEVALSALHWLWYFVPHGTVAYVLWRRPDRFGRAAGLVAVTFDLGLLGYWALPTAPPWWAGEHGHLPGVRRIMLAIGERAFGDAWAHIYDSLSGNPYAAMPSLHFASSVSAARALGEVGPRAEALGWAYTWALGAALVYLGEHYVVDLIAGYALADVAHALADSGALAGVESLLGGAPA